MEKHINNNKGQSRHLPFTVPDGYFDELQLTVMNRIATEKVIETKGGHGFKLLMRWAACLAVLVVSSSVYFCYVYRNNIKDNMVSARTHIQSADADDLTIDEVSDFAMLDNDDLYTYISGE